jgi:hypothetical protein
VPHNCNVVSEPVLEVTIMNLGSCRNDSLHVDTVLPHLRYSELEHFTDCFNELPLGSNGGRKLGAGTFGSVSILCFWICVALWLYQKWSSSSGYGVSNLRVRV